MHFLKTSVLIFLIFPLVCSKIKNNSILLDYQELVTIAEDYIVKKDYERASYTYSILEKHFNPFIKEKNNSFLCSYALEDYPKCYVRAKHLILAGIPLTFFKQSTFLNFQLHNTFKLLSEEYSQLSLLSKKEIDSVLIKKLKKLIVLDQEAYCGKISKNEKFLSTSQLDCALEDLVNEHGFFTERNIGPNIENDSILNLWPFYYPLYRHSYQNESSFFQKYITKAFNDGDISYEEYSNIYIADNFNLISVDNLIYLRKDLLTNIEVIRSLSKVKFKQNTKLPFLFSTPIFGVMSKDLPKAFLNEEFINTQIKMHSDVN